MSGINIFNNLRCNLKSLTSKKFRFKATLKRHLNTYFFYSVDEFLTSKNESRFFSPEIAAMDATIRPVLLFYLPVDILIARATVHTVPVCVCVSLFCVLTCPTPCCQTDPCNAPRHVVLCFLNGFPPRRLTFLTSSASRLWPCGCETAEHVRVAQTAAFVAGIMPSVCPSGCTPCRKCLFPIGPFSANNATGRDESGTAARLTSHCICDCTFQEG